MARKRQSVRVKLPFIEWSWYKEVSKKDVDIKYLQDLIDSYLLFIEHQKTNTGEYHEELTQFTKLIVSNGHLIKLSKEYKEKFFKICKFVEDQWGGPGIYVF
jgi:hypothetical protein